MREGIKKLLQLLLRIISVHILNYEVNKTIVNYLFVHLIVMIRGGLKLFVL